MIIVINANFHPVRVCGACIPPPPPAINGPRIGAVCFFLSLRPPLPLPSPSNPPPFSRERRMRPRGNHAPFATRVFDRPGIMHMCVGAISMHPYTWRAQCTRNEVVSLLVIVRNLACQCENSLRMDVVYTPLIA